MDMNRFTLTLNRDEKRVITKLKKKFFNFFKEYTKENKEKFKDFNIRDCQKEAMNKIDEILMKHGRSILLNMTCGTGKTMIECFTINYFATKLEEQNKRGIFCFGSHRLLLNEQLYDELKHFIPDLEKRFIIRVASSDTSKFDKFDKIYIKNNIKKDLKYKHIIILSCAKTMNLNTDKNEKNNINLYQLMKSNQLTFECSIMDEAHKDLSEQTINNIKSISNFFMGCTATAGKKFKTWFDGIYVFSFAQALKLGYVVPPVLYVAVNRFSEKLIHEVSMVKYAFNHLRNNEKKAQLCCFFNKVDRLMDIAKTLRTMYENVNICVLASNKKVAVLDEFGNKTGQVDVINCDWNGIETDKKTILEKLKENKDKDCIILSAFMIQEGIDIPSINGVGIFCRKSHSSLYQAICRGDRKEEGKTHFNVYVPSNLIEENDLFIRSLVFGFENNLDFGGIYDDKGKGKANKAQDLDNLIKKEPIILKTIKTEFKKVSQEFESENQEISFWNALIKDIKNAGNETQARIIFDSKYFDKVTGNDYNKIETIIKEIYN